LSPDLQVMVTGGGVKGSAANRSGWPPFILGRLYINVGASQLDQFLDALRRFLNGPVVA
jgi:hypothetical protein